MKKIIETIKRKWAEYLLEVIVIVGSILGAFALDEWNENRKNNKDEKKILQGLLTTLSENAVQLRSIIEYHEKGVENLDVLISQFYLVEPSISEDLLKNRINKIGYYTLFTYNPNLGYINSVINSGKLSLIKDNEISSFISQFEDLVIDSSELNAENINIWHSYLFKELLRYVPKMDEKWPGKFENSFAELFNDPNIHGFFKQKRVYTNSEITEEKELLDRMNKIINLIENHPY